MHTLTIVIISPNVRIPRCGFLISDSRYWIPVFVSGIPDSLSCTPDSKTQDFRFHKQKFLLFQNPDSITWGGLFSADVYLLKPPPAADQTANGDYNE